MSLLNLYADVLRNIKLAYLRVARNQLTRRDPCHPDLPEIVLTINRLSSQ